MRIELIREKFIKFFEDRGHMFAKAAPIVQKDDPSLMFTNAGMNQFKPYFANPTIAPSKRLVNIQPCLRVSGKHNDIEDVGMDTYHHTMFEMMGTWSFGDYFKREAITWAWELITSVYKIEKDRIYVSTFGGDISDGLEKDVEAYDIWREYVLPDHILDDCTKKDNFWEMGDTGPCGPCTEIHIDIRPDVERKKISGKQLVNNDHPQVIEIWNLVFIQYERLANGSLVPLSAKHIDTGMGLERLAMVLQAKKSNYDTDIFGPLLNSVSEQSGKSYGVDAKSDIAIRVIVDHIRAITFAIADGQYPSNNRAGYVVKRILRRAVRYGYTYLGLQTAFMYRLVEVLAQSTKEFYPYLYAQKDYIADVIKSEEEIFLRTLANGIAKLERVIADVLKRDKIISGKLAFEMYDTYGFPIDLTVLIARESSISIDMLGFEESLAEQKARSKDDAKVEYGDWVQVVNHQESTIFVGYDTLQSLVKIIRYRSVMRGQEVVYQIVLDKTPFYAQGGGQVGDTGYLISGDEKVQIIDTRKENDIIVHETYSLPKLLSDTFDACVDVSKRLSTENNHSATHLLQAALRKTFGDHIEQRGSLVNDKILRFDFSHSGKIESDDIRKIENIVNEKIRQNIPIQDLRSIPIDEARALGATALFGEKYGERVRVVCLDKNFSIELCGGTHVKSTGQMGIFKILTCSSISAGVRRIEAVTGLGAESFVLDQIDEFVRIKQKFKNPKNVEDSVDDIMQQVGMLRKRISSLEEKNADQLVKNLYDQVIEKSGNFAIVASVEASSIEELKTIVSKIKSKYEKLYLVLASLIENKVYVVVWVNKSLGIERNLKAATVIAELAKYINGNGGGNDTFATASGSKVSASGDLLIEANNIWKSINL